MGLKRIGSLFLAILLVTLLALPTAAQTTVIELGRISVTMPQIIVELKGTGYTQTDISATLEAETLEVEQVSAFDPANDSTRVYVLVDLSTSMRNSFELVRKSITAYIDAMGQDDQLVLLTFGKETVDTVLDGTESKEDALTAVQALRCNEGGTLFFEALSRAYQMSTSSTESFDREYVLAFSDGVDYQKGSTTFDEALTQYSSRTLPLYAACAGNTSQTGVDRFGQIARASGGGISMIKNEAAFADLMAQINDVTLIRLRAGSNRADGKEKQLTLKVGALQADYNVPIIRSLPDNQAPVVETAIYDAQKEAFVICFSEKMTGAAEAKAYKVTGPEGAVIGVSGVYYDEQQDAYELRLDAPVVNGSYTISFSGITDASQEANALQAEQTVSVTNGVAITQPDAETEPVEKPGQSGQQGLGTDPMMLAIVAAVVLLIVIAVVVVLVITLGKKKPDEDSQNVPIQPACPTPGQVLHEYDAAGANVMKHHIKADNVVRLQLRIVTGKSSEQNVQLDLTSSVIIGRSDVCDLYVDDTKMSRQHFVIENEGGNLFVTDLQSRNGTMLNGIRINSRHVLHSGDRILAGLSDIYITITGR